MNVRITRLQAGLLVLIGAGAVACTSSNGREKTAAWSCTSADVPMGERVSCTQSALATAPAVESVPESCSGSIDDPASCSESSQPIEYDCTAGGADCPPASETSSGGASSDDSVTGTGEPGTTPDGEGTDDGSSAGPDECAHVPELPYCGGGSGSSTTDSDGSCEKGKCGAPGRGKKDGGAGDTDGGGTASEGTPDGGTTSEGTPDGGTTSEGSTGGRGGETSGDGKPKHYKCVKDSKGNKRCESTPDCAKGTHASACGACVSDGEAGDCVPPSEGGCWVTGGGFVVGPNLTTGAPADGHDNFGGNAKPMKDGRIQGHWNHVDHGTGNHSKGRPEYIFCRHVDEPGPGGPGAKKGFSMNQVYFGGPAEWRSQGAWASGYWFDVVAKDHGEPGSVPHAKNGRMPDTYHYTIRLMTDPARKVSGSITYETKGVLQGGNIQMHPPNGGHPYTPMAMPSWVSLEP